MVSALQITGDEGSDRSEVVKALQDVADTHGLSYTLDSDNMIIHLPDYDEQKLPVVGTVEVPEDTPDEA